jgi:hypothetical protein
VPDTGCVAGKLATVAETVPLDMVTGNGVASGMIRTGTDAAFVAGTSVARTSLLPASSIKATGRV